MNTPADHDPELRCAEYALGVLDADARHALEESAARDPLLQATLERWQRRFAPLAEDIARVAPPGRVWTGDDQWRWWDSVNRETAGMTEHQADRYLQESVWRLARRRPRQADQDRPGQRRAPRPLQPQAGAQTG